MRLSLCAAMAAVALSGCAAMKPPSAQAILVQSAVDAYVKGDFQTFDGFAAKAQAEADAATAAAGPDFDSACSDAATNARRALALARELHGLDASPVFSMSDEARWVYLSADLTDARRYMTNSGNRKGCDKENGAGYWADDHEREGWTVIMGTAELAWQHDLRQRSPADYEQRLATAREQLERNHMGHFVPVRSYGGY
jgi:hypothetical protein